ncbi:protein MALE DISCOVERER 2 [Brachypodium distachyon]|uniref:Protein kinase domain-containing protein n=1 Tax=Brachypodium distachyon TaxID=15368 RepID=I1IV70_BRADI|nr:protein MALE DISCOVERER 2 [Brachypodium distachyon]KQJ92630.1 hypothetical protein BRADI_4g44890v3 [Brachypodium distachyon]KQJ92631.1 hypothetical protein BRADI_4g44890v3 [Brachypodium distachyon]|eukprot:XP_003579053.1 protein MALE DISCOVERER 2 [Brachypodium distachyon]
MEVWSFRVAFWAVLFFFLLSERRGSCASVNGEGRVAVRFIEDSTGSLQSLGEKKVFAHCSWCSDHGRAVALTTRSTTMRKLLRAPSPSQPKTKKAQPETKKPSSVPHWAVYVLCASGVLGLVVIAATVYLLLSRRKKDHTVIPWATGLSGQLRKAFVTGVPSLGRTELEAACEDFSNVIGTVSDCALYKGTLSSGVEIAVACSPVKCAEEWSERSEQQFRNKISVLSKVNHKNFMNLLGYCACDEPFTRMMVFEYAPCGSLFEHLHIREAEHLDWPTRLRIVMGVTYCLEYMNQLDPPVTPRTLSSSSIYLTEDYAAKISDTEFWKDGKEAASMQNMEQESIVYKFGILLLEVISGRVPFSEDHGLLVLWASSYLDGKRPLIAMADPTLNASSSVPDEDVAALCDIVRLCINHETEKRPTIGEVARLMKGVIRLSPEQTIPRNNPLWWAELEIVSVESS